MKYIILTILWINLYRSNDTTIKSNNNEKINKKVKTAPNKLNIVGLKSIENVKSTKPNKRNMKVKISDLHFNINSFKNDHNNFIKEVDRTQLNKKDNVREKVYIIRKYNDSLPYSWIKNLFNFRHFMFNPEVKPLFRPKPNVKKIKKIFIINRHNHPFFNQFSSFIPDMNYLYLKKRFNPMKLIKIRHHNNFVQSSNDNKRNHMNMNDLFFIPHFHRIRKKVMFKPVDAKRFYFNPLKDKVHMFSVKKSFIQKSNSKPKIHVEINRDGNKSEYNTEGNEEPKIIKF